MDFEYVDKSKLAGKHILQAVEYCLDHNGWQAIKFRLDDKTYLAAEDPDDGYRSCLGYVITTEQMRKKFSVPVTIIDRKDWIEFRSDLSCKLFMRIGTDYSEDWYPCCVMDYDPEDMV